MKNRQKRRKLIVALAVDVAFTALLSVVVITAFQRLEPTFIGWHKVVVEPGQSLWGICVSNCPQANTEDVISAVCARDHIGGNQCLQPGQVLLVPTQII